MWAENEFEEKIYALFLFKSTVIKNLKSFIYFEENEWILNELKQMKIYEWKLNILNLDRTWV